MRVKWIRVLFVVAGVYDGILGLAFLIFPRPVFQTFSVTPPNHWGYVHFPALLLLVFASMFFQIATDPVRYRSLMPYGMYLKIAYSGTVFFYQLTAGIPSMWIGWAWADLAFLVAFFVAWQATSAREGETA